MSTTTPVAVVVRVEIEQARIPTFLEVGLSVALELASQVMKIDVEGSRAEPGCLRFDLLRDSQTPNAFVFYEVYKDADAVAFHKEQPHYKSWADFKAQGGVLSQTAYKMDAIDFAV
ncbi:hypothetical protein CTAYLR_008305 [Chrysophaeum taylorii]|uniref:ABM domain-containing protein n=1 Tax=Chrysophaeum taylorii TaxID=2483200 RepID=A0AAD7U6I9_9STRA|nr:hypothetical protein CTAYLR_008305 [Chrysophaeum taylorii]